MDRPALFDRLRFLKPDRRFTPAEVTTLDTLADDLGISRLAPAALRASPAALAVIKEFEGCEKRRADGRLDAYPDPATGGAPWTIGWGSTGPGITRGVVWTQAQADARLAADVATLSIAVVGLVDGFATSQAQFDAMVSFAYNLGVGSLAGSTLLKKHRAGDFAGAADEFGKWNKAGKPLKPMAGLTRRRAAEASLYRGQA